MLRFVIRKLLKKKWLLVSLLIGNLLMVAIASSGSMYSDAMLWRTLTKNLSNYMLEQNKYPGTIAIANNLDDVSKQLELDGHVKNMADELNVPILENVTSYYKSGISVIPQRIIDGGKKELNINVKSFSDIEEHIEIVKGEMYSKEIKENVVDVIVNERTFTEQSLAIGDELTFYKYKNESGESYRIRVAGVFKNADSQDLYWVESPNGSNIDFVMNQELFLQIFGNESLEEPKIGAKWYVIADYTQMRGNDARHIYRVTVRYINFFYENQIYDVKANYFKTVESFLPEAQKLNLTITVLQVPIFILLAVFIFMVSRQMLEMEQNEIAVYKSRGAGKRHILLIYLLQSSVIAGIGFVGGIPLGVLLCKVLGSSSAFLEFVQRSALTVEIGMYAWITAGVGALFSICTMVLPAFRYANVNIVMHKRKKSRINKSPWWKKVFLDVIFLAVSLYGYNQYNQQQEYLAQQAADGAALDPLLYLYSSLFMIGAGLLVFRVLPWIIRLVFLIGRRWWAPSTYASFLKILRTESNQGFIVVFLIMTVAMGLFSAQTARTINADEEERIRYSIGADVVLEEAWASNAEDVSKGLASELIYQEPEFERYWNLDGIESVTKVLVDKKANVSVTGGNITDVLLMGIHTKEFGETAWFKESLMSVHWYEYLNVMSQNTQAILVSSNFQEVYGYDVGDVLTYSNQAGKKIKGIICGFVDYWPSYAPTVRALGSDGVYRETDHFLIVAHLSQLQSNWGITPYQVWIKNKDSSQYLYDFAEETQTPYVKFEDANRQVIEAKNNPVFQGTNGVLTVGFICILLLCIIGFLIYWILSIQSRTLQFGIFRAMGMRMKEILIMLVNEHIFTTGLSIVFGIVIGRVASELFVPLIRIGYSSTDQVIPLEIINVGSDYVRVLGVIGLAIVFCMIILGGLISKIKITQALKLGED